MYEKFYKQHQIGEYCADIFDKIKIPDAIISLIGKYIEEIPYIQIDDAPIKA
jgi:hypothetical protein